MDDVQSREVERIAKSIVEMLEHAKRRPQMYFVPVNFHAVENFVSGFQSLLSHIGVVRLPDIREFREEAERARGYRTPITSLLQLEEQIRLRCGQQDNVATERIDIEIAAWRLLLASLRKE